MTFIIAEAGVNHGGRLDLALRLIAEAKHAGADAVKFQAFDPTRLSPLDWEKRAMLKGLALTETELAMCAAECAHGKTPIEFMVTPMDAEWLEFFCGDAARSQIFNLKRLKIGSGQNRDLYFLAAVAKTGLPVIISNGMATVEQFADSLQVLTSNGATDITILSCVSRYPTPDVDISMAEIREIKTRWPQFAVGFSSHCRSFWPSVAAAYSGATVVEAHLALPGAVGPDVGSSLLPEELAAMVREVRMAGGHL